MGKASMDEYKRQLDRELGLQGHDGVEEGHAEPSEAEQLAALATAPRQRKDGLPVGSDTRRPKPLSQRQIAFTEHVIRGKSLRASYRLAYENNTGSDASISVSANKLMKDPRVKKLIKDGWDETAEHLSEDLAASKRYVLKGLIALSKDGQGDKGEGIKLKAFELMGKACGLFTPTEVKDKAVITADQLKRELAMHMKLLESSKVNVVDVDAKRLHSVQAVQDVQGV